MWVFACAKAGATAVSTDSYISRVEALPVDTYRAREERQRDHVREQVSTRVLNGRNAESVHIPFVASDIFFMVYLASAYGNRIVIICDLYCVRDLKESCISENSQQSAVL